MTDQQEQSGSFGDRELESIFALAKPRPAPPEHVELRVRRAVHAQWQTATAERAVRGSFRYVAVAASLVVAVAAGLLLMSKSGPGAPAFEGVRVARVTGQANLATASGDVALSASGPALVLARGDAIETGLAGGATLELGTGRELRVGSGTRAIFAEAGVVRLERGKLYLDSGHRSAGMGEIVVDTPRGRVRHLGTRFLVALTPDELRVDVRDGRVEVSSPALGPRIAGPGQALLLSEHGEPLLSHDGAYGPQWQWVERLVPPLSIEGKSLYSVINWAARESGRTVAFENADLESAARRTVLHGDLVLTDPIRGLSQTMLTTRLDYKLRDDIIVIVPRP